MIDTREELVGALHEAAEIEHGLMLQYLFPALSMKKRLDEGLTAAQQAAARRWEAAILGVAVEEMGHLGTVCNLLSAIGEGPHFGRPNFPQATGYYPFDFDLMRFGDEALYRMLVFELPRGFDPPEPPVLSAVPAAPDLAVVAPDPLEFRYVGELYEKIRDGFTGIPQGELFVGPAAAQVSDTFSVTLDLRPVTDRSTAIAAITDIEDGEGAVADSATSHYARFLSIRKEFADKGRFQAARAVARNPQTRRLRGTGQGTLIDNAETRLVAELFNHIYGTTLLVLQQFFSYGQETGPQSEALRASLGHLMSTAVRPLAEVLTELPAHAHGPERAGAPFELYGAVAVSPYADARWTILLERLDAFVVEAEELGASVARVGSVGRTVSFIRRRLAAVAP